LRPRRPLTAFPRACTLQREPHLMEPTSAGPHTSDRERSPGNELPKISIVTPALNCGAFIGRCIESILAQQYPDIEHIVMDGGSTDGTVDVLGRYPHLVWRSEKDRGEADALNKAFRMATGEIVTWLNADDFMAEGALHRVAARYQAPGSFHVLYGNVDRVTEQGEIIDRYMPAPAMSLGILLRWWLNRVHPKQHAMYFRRSSMFEIGPFNEQLHFSIDYEYWIRFIKAFPFTHENSVLAYWRDRLECKSRDTEPDQIKSHWKVVLPHLPELDRTERLAFWQGYCAFYLRAPSFTHEPPALGPDDQELLNQALDAFQAALAGPAAPPPSAPAIGWTAPDLGALRPRPVTGPGQHELGDDPECP